MVSCFDTGRLVADALARLVALAAALAAGLARGTGLKALAGDLRAAEAATRRLLVVMAAGLAALPARPARPRAGPAAAPGGAAPRRRPARASFRLVEPLPCVPGPLRRYPPGRGLRISLAGLGPPRAPAPPLLTRAERLRRRLEALTRVLAAPERAASRLARWLAARPRRAPIRARPLARGLARRLDGLRLGGLDAPARAVLWNSS